MMSSLTADVLVIGGGVNGSSIAYQLARKGVKDVVLVEKGHIASGPTGRSSGIVRQHYTIRTLAEMARDSLRVFANFADAVGGDAGFVQTGAVFSCPDRDSEALRRTVAMHRSIGIRADILAAAELSSLVPGVNLNGISLAAYEPDAGYADPAPTANGFAQAAEALGVTILRNTEVTGIQVESGRIVSASIASTSNGATGSVATRNVVNAAGPWADRIAAMVGSHLPIYATRHPVVILQRPPAWRGPLPVWLDVVEGWYYKPERNPGLMVGSMHVGADQKADLETYGTQPSYEETEQYAEAAGRRFPALLDGGLAQGGWAGLYDVTPDGQPVIDRDAAVEGYYCAAGFSGHGFKLSPSVGIAVAELITGGKSVTYDLAPFRHARFDEGKLTRSAYDYSIVG